ncbi:hypothetical protein A3H80_03520 [Candidatus Roizmanbacteria bacterium RIFCSPLOWO2_02_FULL_37_19]|uniref:ribose-phosphate diphosphokinase n=1 Tax=Candidatus Roizmanbacteria bacterium RIFCSPHIGHO2_02_FULL_37_24 TaxID=1802037 RepID=A0A1F7GV14_9BACT|nr:MAG: hypothetical protein A2862_04710 [Candidatus Roizmanbacteria bacterium RIFCSPHIGHO2_01_FULL_38_41]OGK22957.1 MAG: hypothetical protein A3C24_03820 [Candidatus Roizmanbacteria bacterium RIFCSPHIGHO2_02_FULL_37_24]OGK33589.1 MAG: hypothetical protein A3E10_04965 [Candidatus Roizmanbacteria bacterium RIFCSPHIGHO2_12_FULL_37_23]OGK44206.1 MAG: hypothetical protein A2956_00915 [Candidatus Roizmanbacteria bacterium RIFCSPLOWO2_01_FULL_37_57]OGK55241.1 MAG: hypothetical protein A3H80_03520 [Ca
MKLFSGSSNIELSKKVAQKLGLTLSKAEIVRFDNSEVRVRIEEDVKNEICVVIQSTSNPTDTRLMELFFFCDALKRQEARKVIGVIPWFGYARQDIQHREGECVSANVVIRFLESIGFNKIYTVDLHNEATEGAFSIPFKHIFAAPLLAHQVKKYFVKKKITTLTPENIAILAPDQGAIELSRNFGEAFFGTTSFPLSVVEKKRNQDVLNKVKSFGLYGDVKGKHVIIVDDMIVSGSTLISAVDFLLSEYDVKGVYAAITHHDFAHGAEEKLESSNFIRIFTTDTIALFPQQRFKKLEETSIAPLLADELRYLT